MNDTPGGVSGVGHSAVGPDTTAFASNEASCPNNHPADSNDKFCRICGAAVANPSEMDSNAKAAEDVREQDGLRSTAWPRRRWAVMVGFLVVAVLAIILVVVLSGHSIVNANSVSYKDGVTAVQQAVGAGDIDYGWQPGMQSSVLASGDTAWQPDPQSWCTAMAHNTWIFGVMDSGGESMPSGDNEADFVAGCVAAIEHPSLDGNTKNS